MNKYKKYSLLLAFLITVLSCNMTFAGGGGTPIPPVEDDFVWFFGNGWTEQVSNHPGISQVGIQEIHENSKDSGYLRFINSTGYGVLITLTWDNGTESVAYMPYAGLVGDQSLFYDGASHLRYIYVSTGTVNLIPYEVNTPLGKIKMFYVTPHPLSGYAAPFKSYFDGLAHTGLQGTTFTISGQKSLDVIGSEEYLYQDYTVGLLPGSPWNPQ